MVQYSRSGCPELGVHTGRFKPLPHPVGPPGRHRSPPRLQRRLRGLRRSRVKVRRSGGAPRRMTSYHEIQQNIDRIDRIVGNTAFSPVIARGRGCIVRNAQIATAE